MIAKRTTVAMIYTQHNILTYCGTLKSAEATK